jgi:hypothetical protein
MVAITTQCAKHFAPVIKTYRVTIKQPKGVAEFSVTVSTTSRFEAMQHGISMAKACGETVRVGSAVVTELTA